VGAKETVRSSMAWAADSGGRAITVMPETTSIIQT